LLAAPDVDTPLGLRDRTMLELMYASGLRVSELVTLKTFHVSLQEGVLRVLGKGNKERLVPFGEEAQPGWCATWQQARPAILGGRQTDALFVTAAAHAGMMSRVMFWMIVKKHARGGVHRAAFTAHAAPCLCHPPAQPRCGPARGADAAGPCRHFHHHHLHPCGARAAAAAACAAPPPRLTTCCGR
jgi:site-specific recombinase XerD